MSFLSSRRLQVALKYKLSSKCTISYRLKFQCLFRSTGLTCAVTRLENVPSYRQNLMSRHWHFNTFLAVEYFRIISSSVSFFHNSFELITFEWQFDFTNQNDWKIFLFFIPYFLNLKCQDLVLEITYSNSSIRS